MLRVLGRMHEFVLIVAKCTASFALSVECLWPILQQFIAHPSLTFSVPLFSVFFVFELTGFFVFSLCVIPVCLLLYS